MNGVVAQPTRTVPTRDTRFNPATGNFNNDPATAYFDASGNYVIVNERTNDVVQISNRNKTDWKWTPR